MKTHLFQQSYPDIIMQLVCGCSRHGGLGSYYVYPPRTLCNARRL